MRLSILICSIPSRAAFLRRLRGVLDRQCVGQLVEVIVDERPPGEVSIGAKRNALLRAAKGDYVCFCDDDDLVSPRYVQLILAALRTNPDCAELWGEITEDGVNPKRFHHSIHHQEWCEKGGVYLRYCNHLNAIRRDLALQAGFPDNSYGEDKTFSDRVKPLLKTMGPCSQVLYQYLYRSKK